MLISEVVNTKSIALSTTNAASNDIPYLGLQFFPETKKAGLDLKWIKTSSGLPVSLAPSNFDSLPILRARDGIDIQKTQMAFFREEMDMDETLLQEIDRINDENDPYLKTALDSIYDDTTRLVRGAEVVPERMRMSLLATNEGHPAINIVGKDNVTYAYNYDPNGSYAANHYIKNQGTSVWTDKANSKPLTDLNNAKKSLRKLGKMPAYVLMNGNTFNLLVENEQIKSAILSQNVTANIFITDELVKQVIKLITGLTIIVYDKMYIDDAGTEQYFYPDKKVTLLPAGAVGKTVFGTTPEERTARQVSDVDVTVYGTGITIATKAEYGPPYKFKTIASEIVLPSYEGMDSTYVIEVA